MSGLIDVCCTKCEHVVAMAVGDLANGFRLIVRDEPA
jgi:hypothetical protein